MSLKWYQKWTQPRPQHVKNGQRWFLFILVLYLPDLALPADVPDVELESLRLHRLDVEALRRRDVLGLLGGQLLQQCRLAGVVQPQQQDPQLLVRRRLQLAKDRQQTHFRLLANVSLAVIPCSKENFDVMCYWQS